MRLLLTVFVILVIGVHCEVRYAVSILYPSNSTVSGVIAIKQESPQSLTNVIATVRGLEPLTRHGIHIHAFGDLTNSCTSTGAHYNPFNKNHGGLTSDNRHVGDLTNIMSDADGNVHMNLQTDQFSLFGQYSVVGRAFVIHAKQDDLGLGGDAQSLKTGNAGARISCGVIGLTDSFKKVKP